MERQRTAIKQSTNSATLADVLERILDKGLVIAGDIKIKLVDIELLTIQIRLVICSVEKAKEIGLDFWATDKDFNSGLNTAQNADELEAIKKRIEILEFKKIV
ncbi:MAG: gas vesicle protein [Candidatus Brocadiaceae bacterium]|nr:gas vesicle protein [Candidatus Brocadiaceae bacterium]